MDNLMLDAAYQLAASRQMACKEDIDLLVKVLGLLPEQFTAVQLGAGSGTMALVFFAAKPKALLYSVDHDQQNLNWEKQVFDNMGRHRWLTQLCGDSAQAGRTWDRGPVVRLLIVDADHTMGGVRADFRAWLKHLDNDSYVFVHDYDADTAPQQYPGVKAACDFTFRAKPLYKEGWSAVFEWAI